MDPKVLQARYPAEVSSSYAAAPRLTDDPQALPAPLPGTPVAGVIVGPVVDPARAWATLGDTDLMNRLGGNSTIPDQRMECAGDGLPTVQGAMTGPAGLAMPFEEAWTSWVRGRYFRQIREVRAPFLSGTDAAIVLEPVDGGVRPRARLALHGPTLARPLLALNVRKILSRWQQALDDLAAPPAPLRTLPAAADAALSRWASDDPLGLAPRLRDVLVSDSPTELRRLRPFALADRWALDREDVLAGLLGGVRAGALELYWSVRCVRCYGQVQGTSSLSDLVDHATCPSCRIDFEADLGDNVEVLLAPHPAVVPRVEERFCTLYPAGAPDQHAVWTLGPGESLAEEIALGPGRWRLGSGGGAEDLVLEAGAAGPGEAEWAPDAQGAVKVSVGPVQVRLHNPGDARRRVSLTRDAGQAPRVLASTLTTMPAFRRQFAHQVLSPDLRLSVRSVALVFTDLSGSTAMYEELGDARAFAVVRDHFTVLRAEIEAAGGVVVKTIGDAVMAAFDTPLRATQAAVAMQQAFTTFAAGLDVRSPPGLKVGIHHGPALAVHSEQAGLDWFGGTVNLAARAEGLASRGEIILTRQAAEDDEVRAWIIDQDLAVAEVERTVKGFAGTVTFARLRP